MTIRNSARQQVARPHTRQDDSAPQMAALGRHWPAVLLAGILAAGAAYAASTIVLSPVYESSATIIVKNQTASPSQPGDGPAPAEPFVDDQSLSETFEQLALQPSVAIAVAADLKTEASDVTARVRVRAVPRTPLVIITFRDGTPAGAARGAQAYTAQFVQSTQRRTFLPGRALVVSGATSPTEPAGPRVLLNTLVGGVAGLLVGLLLSLAATQSRRDRLPHIASQRPLAPERGSDVFKSTPPFASFVEAHGNGRRTGS